MLQLIYVDLRFNKAQQLTVFNAFPASTSFERAISEQNIFALTHSRVYILVANLFQFLNQFK
jgi:hypothetical protein